jgi:hypothetical protein
MESIYTLLQSPILKMAGPIYVVLFDIDVWNKLEKGELV